MGEYIMFKFLKSISSGVQFQLKFKSAHNELTYLITKNNNFKPLNEEQKKLLAIYYYGCFGTFYGAVNFDIFIADWESVIKADNYLIHSRGNGGVLGIRKDHIEYAANSIGFFKADCTNHLNQQAFDFGKENGETLYNHNVKIFIRDSSILNLIDMDVSLLNTIKSNEDFLTTS